MKKSTICTLLLLTTCLPARAESLARQMLQDSGIQGGLVVHVDCGDGRFLLELHASERFLVHGLDSRRADIERARQNIRSRKLSGPVSVELCRSNRLPYSDNLVNLLIVEDPARVPREEILRVLCPRGVAYVKQNESTTAAGLAGWEKIVKPWPSEIDQWTHFLHDASGNAVAKDTVVGSPRHLQWTAGPKRTRDHDALSSFTTMTSSHGRVFYILDEGPTSQIHRRAQWQLIARDAFNGVELWKQPIASWVSHLYNFRAGPVHMTRRLVSVAERVYVTLGFHAPVSALDAATGEQIRTYQGSENAEEMILVGDVLLVVTGDPGIFDAEAPQIDGYWETRRGGAPSVVKSIVAYRASTGALLWRKSDPAMAYLVPLSLTANAETVFYLDHKELHALDLVTGASLWATPYASEGLFLRNYAPTVVVHDDAIVCLSIDQLAAFSVKDGQPLWSKRQGYQGFASPGDLFVIDDRVWTFPTTAGVKYESKERLLGEGGTLFQALDLHTGEIRQSLAKKDVWPGGHHHRCYRNKATQQFAICGRRGLEFVDLTGGNDHTINWWVRGICQYGIMPCNGMVYVPPDPCQCFGTIKVDGLLALAADSSWEHVQSTDPLERGEAYQESLADDHDGVTAGEWPTYRHDAAHSGATDQRVPVELKREWVTDIGSDATAVVVARNQVLVSCVASNTVCCLSASTGELLWQFTTRGPVDTPPTVADGLAVFGSRDGHVYALDAADGRLVWSYRAGPCDRRIVDHGHLESIWPVHGSVLVLDDIVYCAAGRSSFLDGGIRLLGLDLHTGARRHETLIQSEPADDNNSGALPDILVSDGEQIQMRQLAYDPQLKPLRRGGRGSFSAPAGFLQPEWGHRLTWRLSGAIGNLLVFDDQYIYGAQSRYTGWKKNKENWPPTHSGHLHQKYSRYKPEWFPIGNSLFAHKIEAGSQQRRTKVAPRAGRRWSLDMDIQIRAMVLAGDVLFAAGWPDAVTVMDQATGGASERELQDPKLWAISTDDGKLLAQYDLPSLPVFDGAAVAYGRLFLSLQDGNVVCFGK